MKEIHNINSALKTSQDLHLQQNTVLMGIKKISKFNLLSV